MTKKHHISPEVRYLHKHANELMSRGHFQQAIEHYDKAIENVPDFACFWNCKGVALEGLNRISEALTCYEKAIEADPYNAEAWFNRGVALRKAGRKDESDKSEKIASCLEQGKDIQKFLSSSPEMAIPFH